MRKQNYSTAMLAASACALMMMPSQAHADAKSDAEIAALKTQLMEMAAQQKKAAAVIEGLAAQVEQLQKQASAQTRKVSAIEEQQISQAAQPVRAASDQPEGRKSYNHDSNKYDYNGDAHDNSGIYLSLFGGGGTGSSTSARQLGTVYFVEAAGGPQSINGRGKLKNSGTGVVGAHMGYEWQQGEHFRPAVEIEALYLPSTDSSGKLDNTSARLTEGLFDNTLPTDTSVLLANAVVGFQTPYQGITPYIGGGIGAAYRSVNGATSSQLNPAEAGINHFNSENDSSVLTAAAQLKAGVRVAITDNAYLFGEYRYLYIGAHDQTFGATDAVGHAATSPWTVSYDGTSYNLGTVGIGMKF